MGRADAAQSACPLQVWGLFVISLQPLRGGAGAAAYYLQREAGCDHQHERSGVDYYVNDREELGRWVGQGAAALGLTGPLSRDRGGPVLAELLDGRLGSELLARPVWRMRDPSGGEPVRVDVRRAGYDVTFSAPKSVSVLLALGSDEIAAQVRQAHQAALTDALALLEQLAARAARGHQGKEGRAPRIATTGLIAAAFDHSTSRALDPQLHTHAVLVNLVRGVDGRWSALDSRTLYLQATTASHLYQHRLRAELTARLGVGWEPIERGISEIRGIPLDVRKAFSQRKAQIDAALDTRPAPADPEQPVRRRGVRGRGLRKRRRHAAARVACLATRPAKAHEPENALRRSWRERAAAAGFGPDQLSRLLAQPSPPPAHVDVDRLAAQVLGEHGVTREASTFDQGTVLREICQQLPAGAQVSSRQILHLTRQLIRTGQVIPVVSGDAPAFTTAELLQTEQDALDLARRRSADPQAVVSAAQAATAAARSGLRPDQQAMAFALLTSGRPVDVVTGPAGSGKTAALRIAAAQWSHDHRIAGTAVAALTAQGLQEATGAPAVSLARLLHHPDRHLPSGGVLIVDEAGMIGTRSLHNLLQLAADRDCKLVLVGDPAQLPELQAGGLFKALTEESTALHIGGHHRQRDGWEQQALSDLRAGRIAEALDSYEQHHRLHTGPDASRVQQQLVEDYLQARAQQADPWQVAVLASRRSDVTQLNGAIRQRLRDAGLLGRHVLTVTTDEGEERDYRLGDQVLITRNDHSRQLLNGTTGTVTALGRDDLVVRTRDGQEHRLSLGWLRQGRLDHAYALTLHKAQGRTVHTALLLADAGLGHEAGYVGLSRGTHANHLYLHPDSPLQDLDGCTAHARHEPASRPPRERLLQRHDAHRIALQQLQRASDARERRSASRTSRTGPTGQRPRKANGPGVARPVSTDCFRPHQSARLTCCRSPAARRR